MTWTKLDDNIFDHPKMLKAGEDAANLYVRALVYCNRYLTDGRIEEETLGAVTRRPDAEALVAKLVKVGLWEEHPDGGWLVHNFHEHNPSAEEVLAKRAELSAKRSEAGRRGGVRSGEARSNEAKAKQVASEATKQNGSKGEATSEANVEANAKPRPDPSRPDREEGSAPARAEPTPSSHGPATTPTGRSLLDAFRDAAGSRATLVGNMSEERGLARMLDRLAPSTAEVQSMADALGSPASWWPPGKRAAPKHVTLRDLAGWKEADGEPGWAPLSALIAHIRAEAAARARREAEERAAAEAAARRAPPPEDRPQITPEAQARIDEAKRRMKAALWTYGDPPLDGAKQ